jgi:signal transduction histidine kinase
MKRSLVVLSVLLPPGSLLFLRLSPSLDATLQAPLFHFHIVTFTTFAAAVVAIFVAISVGREGAPRHTLTAAAFAVMGGVFLIHGITTPNALIAGPHPGIRWAAWLTLFSGGLLFALAGLDDPRRPTGRLRPRLIVGLTAGGYAAFVLLTALAPNVLSAIDQSASPWHALAIFLITLALWLFAALRLWLLWRRGGDRVDGLLALACVWLAVSTVSLHQFPVWHLSWWLYHVLLLASFLMVMAALVGRYEQRRYFRLTHYYAAIGLIVTAALALIAADLFARSIDSAVTTELEQAVLNARLAGLLIAGITMGLLFVILLNVVRRADRLITTRSRELARAYADLRAAEGMRDDLTDMLVHDLRTPLTTVTVNLDLITRVEDDPAHAHSRRRFLSNARDSTKRMLGLINDMLDVSKMEAGQMLQPMREVLDVQTLLRERSEAFAPQAEADRKRIRVDAPPNLPTVLADPALISRVLDNLISNALKYTDPGGQVTLAAQANGREMCVRVQDDGVGIPPDYVERIFDKFVQVPDADRLSIRRGSGLGLTFCRLAVEAHGGRIWAESQLGLGSTFSFTLQLG